MPTPRVTSRSLGVLAALAIPLVVAGCSSAGSGATSGPTTSSRKTAAPVGASLDVCELVPAKVAAQATGLPLTRTQHQLATGPGSYECTYSHGAITEDLEPDTPDVTIYTSENPTTIDRLKSGLDSVATADAPTVQVAGVGDVAYAGWGGLAAQFGDKLVRVNALEADKTGDHSKSTALAQAVVDAIQKAG